MSASLSNLTMFSIDRLTAHLRVPLYRNGYALVASSALASGFGLLFWVFAARYYSTDEVGLNSAIIAAMIFLANISQLNLVNAMTQFIPTAGRSTTRLVLSAYLISTVIGLAASLLFILGVGLWAPELRFLKSSPLFILWFVLATMGWCVLVLQDSALTGLRQTAWVPVANLVLALAKIGLVVAFAITLPKFGIFASWTVPLLFLIILINALLFGHLIPRHVQTTQERAVPLVLSQIARYVGGDYLASLVWMGAVNLLPLMVLQRAGATANAYFFLCWTMTYSLYTVSRNMGSSLMAEAATDQTKIDEYSYRVLVQTARLLVPAVVIIVVGAPYLLKLFGAGYASEGTTLLRLLALSALPNIVTSVYVSYARLQRRMVSLVIVLTALCGGAVTLSYLLLDLYGIAGIGAAWLVSQTVVATFLLFTHLRRVWLSYLDVNAVLRPLAAPRHRWRRWRSRGNLDYAAKLLPQVLAGVSGPPGAPPPALWQPQYALASAHEVATAALGPAGGPTVALLKLPSTSTATANLSRQAAVLRALHSEATLGGFPTLVPTLLAEGSVAGQPYFVEQMLPGRDARELLTNPLARMRFEKAAAAAIGHLHRSTAKTVTVDRLVLERWVDNPALMVRRVCRSSEPESGAAIRRLTEELHGTLTGRTLTVSWVHGDFTPGNILVTPDGASVTGIVDWGQAARNGLPQVDVVLLLMATRMLAQRREMGDIIPELLQDHGWTPHELASLDMDQPRLPDRVGDMRTLVLLAWLQHVATNLTKSIGYSRHWFWISRNILGVLRHV